MRYCRLDDGACEAYKAFITSRKCNLIHTLQFNKNIASFILELFGQSYEQNWAFEANTDKWRHLGFDLMDMVEHYDFISLNKTLFSRGTIIQFLLQLMLVSQPIFIRIICKIQCMFVRIFSSRHKYVCSMPRYDRTLFLRSDLHAGTPHLVQKKVNISL